MMPLAWVWEENDGEYRHHEGDWWIRVKFYAGNGYWFWVAIRQKPPKMEGGDGYGSAEDAKADAQAWFEVEGAHG